MKKKANDSLVAVIFLLVISAMTVGGIFWLRSSDAAWSHILQWILWGVTAFCWLFAVVGTAMFFSERNQQAELAREMAAAQRRAGLVAPETQTDYFEQLVAINLTNLSDYYALVRSHAARSFVLAAMAATLGFLLVCGALVFAVYDRDSAAIGYAGVAAGTITEMVAAVFFVLYSRTVRQLKDYHDSLLDVQNVLLSLKMVESVDEQDRRAELTAALIKALLDGRGSGPEHSQSSE